MKKTLLISREHPLPEDHGSSIRTMNFVRFFKKYGIVDLAYSYKSNSTHVKNSIFSNEFYLEDKGASKSFKRQFISGLIKGIPMPVRDYGKASQRFLLDTINEKDYDFIIVRYIVNASLIFNVGPKYKMRTIIDFDDILTDSLYESRFSFVKGRLKKKLLLLNKKSLRIYEKKCLEFGISLFCSEKDRATMVKEHESSKTFVVPNIYTNESFENYYFEDGFNRGNILLFVGALAWGPNKDGLRWFIETIFPDFKKKYYDAKLLIVGRSPADYVKGLCRNRDGIELHLDAPDVKKYYSQCKAAVVPLLAASGTRIKILEAALANTPVLSTPKGAEGLNLVKDKDVLLFRNSREFCDKYSKILDRCEYNSLIQSAKDAVASHYSIQRFNSVMEQVLRVIDHEKCNMAIN
jgi:glycosyltransferase involved in cell wall biosynthesis